ncbi:uncharacterized protein MONBRDRAFT_27707 [Monosiga brevicollis MX1]|uniref:Uncharacterized protein n=1 Tax=Monosiga brevicollis TaxID=81824 RepID=A9V627_MONBE|nr:uncharacterized protein MONBRDRAFT_27707 [Monosiga brevicollis MX1]EDQ87000.1 predicted protein [Monosiga brevicollis MX1]|eukprot:XP_001748239.1 hypothetical protein [Monosiga brevicollis MX1]
MRVAVAFRLLSWVAWLPSPQLFLNYCVWLNSNRTWNCKMTRNSMSFVLPRCKLDVDMETMPDDKLDDLVARVQQQAKVHFSAADFVGLSQQELASAYIKLSDSYKAVMGDQEQLTMRLQNLQNDVIQFQSIQRQILEMEHRHSRALSETQVFQTRLERIGKYKETFKTQLKVIEALEQAIDKEAPKFLDPTTVTSGSRYQRLLAKQLMLERQRLTQRRQQQQANAQRQKVADSQSSTATAPVDPQAIQRLDKQIHELETQNQQLRNQLYELHNAQSHLPDSTMDMSTLVERRNGLESEIERLKQAHRQKVSALQVQLASLMTTVSTA